MLAQGSELVTPLFEWRTTFGGRGPKWRWSLSMLRFDRAGAQTFAGWCKRNEQTKRASERASVIAMTKRRTLHPRRPYERLLMLLFPHSPSYVVPTTSL